MNWYRNLSLKYKLSIPIIIIFFLVNMIWAIFVYKNQENTFLKDINSIAKSKIKSIETNVKRISKKALIISSGFSSLNRLSEFYNDPDENSARQNLRDYITPIVDKIKRDLGFKILKVHFHKPPARSFLRIWKKPGKGDGGDDLSSFRFTILRISENHKPVIGVELGRGGFVMRGLSPIFDLKGNYLGSVEVLFPLKELIKQSFISKDEGLYFFVNKDIVGKVKLFSNLKGKTKGKFVLKGSAGIEYDVFKDLLDENFLIKSEEDLFFQKKAKFIFVGIPVKDFSGKTLGTFVYIKDIYYKINSFKKTITSNLLMSIIFIAILSFFLFKYLSNSMKDFIDLKDAFKKASSGDLSVRLKAKSNDEIGLLIKDFNNFLSDLSILIGDTKSNAENINSSAESIATTTEEMSAASDEQTVQASSVASAVEQMAASFSEIGANVKNTQQNAIKSSELTKNSSETISQTIESINTIAERTGNLADIIVKLRESSTSITDIVNVINDIADQTNLLALNAAIEAARAGEAGRGFAVVADEVRKLAERTSRSTKEIADIINKLQKESDQAEEAMKDAIEEVDRGKILGKNSINALKDVQKSSEGIVELMTIVTKSIDEITLTVGEVNNNVQQIAESIQETNSAINDINKSASQLNTLSESMKSSIEKFKLN